MLMVIEGENEEALESNCSWNLIGMSSYLVQLNRSTNIWRIELMEIKN